MTQLLNIYLIHSIKIVSVPVPSSNLPPLSLFCLPNAAIVVFPIKILD